MQIKHLAILLSAIFLLMVIFYLVVQKPEKYASEDLYSQIVQRGTIKVGINTDSKPFGFVDSKGEIVGYDVDLARYIAQYLLRSPNAVEIIPVTPSDRFLKTSTGEVDILISTVTINPQRKSILAFSVPYDVAGQAILVKANSRISGMNDLAGQLVGVVFGTTAEKNMKTLVPNADIIGFKSYHDAYEALKSGKINAITSDDTILSRFALEDKSVKLLPKRYSKEPYGIAFRKAKSSEKLKEHIDYAIVDLKRKNVIVRLRKKWGLS